MVDVDGHPLRQLWNVPVRLSGTIGISGCSARPMVDAFRDTSMATPLGDLEFQADHYAWPVLREPNVTNAPHFGGHPAIRIFTHGMGRKP